MARALLAKLAVLCCACVWPALSQHSVLNKPKRVKTPFQFSVMDADSDDRVSKDEYREWLQANEPQLEQRMMHRFVHWPLTKGFTKAWRTHETFERKQMTECGRKNIEAPDSHTDFTETRMLADPRETFSDSQVRLNSGQGSRWLRHSGT